MNENNEQLVSGKKIATNVLWNIAGRIAPLLLAVIAVPLLIKGLGDARAGVLFLIVAALKYFNLFQFGLGRALTKFIAERLGESNENEVSSLVWTGMILMVILGAIAAVSMFFMAPWMAHDQLKVPVELQAETIQCLYVFALAMPAVISVAAFKSVLEAYQRFDLKNALEVALGILNYAGLLFIVLFSKNLVPLSWFVAAGGLITWIVYLVCCARVAPTILNGIRFQRSVLWPLVSFGGWETVRSLFQPIIMYADRFLIGSLVSMAAVTYYTTAYEAVTQMWILPTSLVGVVFPAMAMSLVQDRVRAKKIYEGGVKNLLYCALSSGSAGRDFRKGRVTDLAGGRIRREKHSGISDNRYYDTGEQSGTCAHGDDRGFGKTGHYREAIDHRGDHSRACHVVGCGEVRHCGSGRCCARESGSGYSLRHDPCASHRS